jgi:hypothetical protein
MVHEQYFEKKNPPGSVVGIIGVAIVVVVRVVGVVVVETVVVVIKVVVIVVVSSLGFWRKAASLRVTLAPG